MPVGVNHAASARPMARSSTSSVAAVVAMSHPTASTTSRSTTRLPTSGRAARPVPPSPPAPARGGMGRAVYYQGEFFILGGETLTAPARRATVSTPAWTSVTPLPTSGAARADMPTARHGIFPVLRNGRIYVFGGGVKASFSQSAITEIFEPRLTSLLTLTFGQVNAGSVTTFLPQRSCVRGDDVPELRTYCGRRRESSQVRRCSHLFRFVPRRARPTCNRSERSLFFLRPAPALAGRIACSSLRIASLLPCETWPSCDGALVLHPSDNWCAPDRSSALQTAFSGR